MRVSPEEYVAMHERIQKHKAFSQGITPEKLARSAEKRLQCPKYLRACVLNAMADAGEIQHLRKRKEVEIDGIKRVADFSYEKGGKRVAEFGNEKVEW